MLNNKTRYYFLALVMSGVFLSTMDSGMVNVALPTAMRDLAVTLPEVELIVTVYLITITVTLVLWGQLGDRIGRCNSYLTGMATFSGASVCCFLAPSLSYILLFRFFQAMGAAMMMSSGPAIIKTVFPADRLGRSLGLIGIATAGGLLTGPYVSGLVLTQFGWKTIFVITLPVSLTALAVGLIYLRQHFPLQGGVVRRTFDWRGCCFWILLTVSGISFLRGLGNMDLFHLLYGVSFLVFGALFLKNEGRVPHPILPLQLLSKRYFWIGATTAALSFAGLFTVLILLPFYLDYLRNMSSSEIGKVMMAIPATLILLSPLAGYIYDKIGARILTALGLFASSVALFILSQTLATVSVPTILFLLALMGAGQSIFLSPNSASVLSKVGEDYAGVSAGILATARNFGMVFGATFSVLLVTVFYGAADGDLEKIFLSLRESAFLEALQKTFMVTAILPFSGAVLSIFRGSEEL